MVHYNYKIKAKYLKNHDNKYEIEKYGFVRFQNEEQEGEVVFAIPVMVSKDSVIVRGLIADLNNPKWQKAAHITWKNQIEKFKKSGLEWTKSNDGKYTVVETEEMYKEFGASHLIVCADNLNNIPHGIVFIKGPDSILRADKNTIDIACPDLIKKLVDSGIVYKARVVKKAGKNIKA